MLVHNAWSSKYPENSRDLIRHFELCNAANKGVIGIKWNKIASLKKEAECKLATLQLLIAGGEKGAYVFVKFSNIIMKGIC